MPMIDVVIQPEGGARVFFDLRDAVVRPADQRHIEQVMARSFALLEAEEELLPSRIM